MPGPGLEEGQEQEEEVIEETGDWVEFSMACTIAGSVLENSDSSWDYIKQRVKTTTCG